MINIFIRANCENWNRLYGKKGLVQYQCVIPENHAFEAIKKLLSQAHAYSCASFLAVLKRLGNSKLRLIIYSTQRIYTCLRYPL